MAGSRSTIGVIKGTTLSIALDTTTPEQISRILSAHDFTAHGDIIGRPTLNVVLGHLPARPFE